MNQTEDLWKLSRNDLDFESTENVISYVKAQAKNIQNSVTGIKVKFSPISSTYTALASSLIEATEKVSKTTFTVEAQEEVDNDLEDVNKKFKSKYYGFSIFTDSYKFQVFTLIIPLYYPIYPRADEDIFEEIKNKNVMTLTKDHPDGILESEQQLRNFLIAVFRSKKMTAVLETLSKQDSSK